MNKKEDPSPSPSRRLSPDELAGEVARRLRLGRSQHGEHRRRRFDIVTVSRISMVLGVILLGIGVVFAVAWIGRLAGFETTGTVIEETPVFGCPGEPEVGVLFSGETVELVGRSEDGAWFAVRDGRGPGNVVYADAARISAADDPAQLSVRSCDPRNADEVAAAAISREDGEETTTTTTAPTTTTPGATTSTSIATGATAGRPPRSNTASPGTTTTTTTTSPDPGSSSSSTTAPGSTSSTTQPGSTSSSTSTIPPTTTSSTTTSTSTTTTTTTTTTTLPDTTTTTTTMTTTTPP